MAQSPEFGELRWVPPRSWTAGRPAGQPTVVVIHSTEGSKGSRSAEDGAAYDQRRTDGTSTHFFCDSDSVVQCVRTTDRAHHARATGNRIGIGFELCGRASQTAAQWHDATSLPMLRLAARYVAKCCAKHRIPPRRVTVAQLRSGAKGICGHVDITHAFGESTHTDPGRHFPWAEFLAMVRDEMEDDMDAAQFLSILRSPSVAAEMRALPWQYNGRGMPGVPEHRSTLWVLGSIYSLVKALAEKTGVDPAELAAIQSAAEQGVVAAADDLADAIAAKLPDADRAQVVAAVREVFADAGQPDPAPAEG